MSANADLLQLRLIQLALPAGGLALNITEGYFDESAAGTGQTIFCVGGYLVDSQAAPAMTEQWQAMLHSYGVSLFHMKDCAPGNGQFKHLGVEDRSELVKQLINIIKEHVIAGVTCNINIKQYKKNPFGWKLEGVEPNYYQMSLWLLLLTCQQIVEEEGLEGPILYNFEAGHELERSCSSIISKLAHGETSGMFKNYGGHAFLPKKTGPALLQAADLLVWLTTKNFKNMVMGRKPRADSMALRSGKYWETTFWGKDDGNAVIGIASPYNQGLVNPTITDMNLIKLHSGETPDFF